MSAVCKSAWVPTPIGTLSCDLPSARAGSNLGAYSSPFGAVFDADDRDGPASPGVDVAAAPIADPELWIEESFELSKHYAYATPVSTAKNPVMLTREYETNARNVARTQAALAAVRLAILLNHALR